MNKKIFKILIIVLIILIIIGVIGITIVKFFENKKYNDMQNYTPQEEISDEQLRKTIISLYFKDAENDDLVTEARLIDAKILLAEPYKVLLSMLVQGPKLEGNVQMIPASTIVNKAELNGDVLEVDLSETFVKEFKGNDTIKKLAIKSIVNTLTQLNEVNKVRILINGEKDRGFENSEVNFKQVFDKENM